MKAVRERLVDDDNVIYIYLSNTHDITEICSIYSEDRQGRNFLTHDVHYLITDFEVNQDKPASYHIEALRNLMDSHRQACMDYHGHSLKRCSLHVLHLLNSPSDGWPDNQWEAPKTVADRTSKPPIIAAFNSQINELNKQFSDVNGFRPTQLCDIGSAGYLDCFKYGNSLFTDTAVRAVVLNNSLRQTWGDRLLRLVSYLKRMGCV